MFDASNLDFLEIDSERESKQRDDDSSDHRQGEDQWQITTKAAFEVFFSAWFCDVRVVSCVSWIVLSYRTKKPIHEINTKQHEADHMQDHPLILLNLFPNKTG